MIELSPLTREDHILDTMRLLQAVLKVFKYYQGTVSCKMAYFVQS